MGVDAISKVLEKVFDPKLKNILENQEKSYQKIKKEIEDIYPKYNDDKPHETNFFNKTMTFSAIEMKTLKDNSSSKLAELLIQGTNMGIIEGRKILNHKNIDQEVKKIIEKYVSMQEDYLENLKTFL